MDTVLITEDATDTTPDTKPEHQPETPLDTEPINTGRIHIQFTESIKGMQNIEAASINAIITDPPYYIEKLQTDLKSRSIRQSSKNSVFHDEFDHFTTLADFQTFMNQTLQQYKRILKPKAQVYMFCSYHHLDWIIQAIKNWGFRYYKPLIWYKPDLCGLFPNQYGCNYEPILWFRQTGKTGDVINHIGNQQRDVFTHTSTNNAYREKCGYHPTPKPIKLIRKLIQNCTNENDIVLDPFIGSGTTAEACIQTGRRCIGFEYEAKWKKTIQQRISQTPLPNIFQNTENYINK